MFTLRRTLVRLALFFVLALVTSSSAARAEVLIRWDHDSMPSPQSLGIATLVVPAKSSTAVRNAISQGYRVFVEIEPSALAGFAPRDGVVAGLVITGKVPAAELRQLRLRLKVPAHAVLTLHEGAKWPHIRTNWVTKNNEVLQVAGRSAQPWIESNVALLRILQAERPGSTPLVTYQWQPITLSDIDEGPSLENYLVAIAEAGSFGGDLLLPLHERFQRRLLAGEPAARAEWTQIRRYIDFYSWNLPNRYRAMANIGVVTSQPMLWFEGMNLLSRHNLPFELVPPAKLATRDLKAFKLLIVLDKLEGAASGAVEQFARNGGKVHTVVKGMPDPNTFALEMRKLLGAGDRVIDIWNGITVLTAPYRDPESDTVLVSVLNYAHQELPVQLRVAGTFSIVQYEYPEEAAALVPHQHRNGYTEFVLPALRVGGRVFLSQYTGSDR
jgi:hypothetical protein